MNFEIFRKEFGGCFNYFFISICIPRIRIGKKDYSFYCLRYLFDFDFPTNFILTKDEISWNFRFCLFGFGFEIYRQWDY